MKIPEILDPNKQLPANSFLWYIAALVLMVVAVAISLSGVWQTEGFVRAVYKGGVIEQVTEDSKANVFSIAPSMMSIVWGIIIYGAFLARRYVRTFSNLPTLILVTLNIVFVSSLIESILPAQSIPLLTLMGKDVIKLNPQQLLIVAILLSWIGMRALSGMSIIVLGWALLARAHDMNNDLGMYGSIYVLCGFLSFMIQTKLPYMVPEGGWCTALFQDFGAIQIAATRNVTALKDVTARSVEGVVTVGAAANGIPMPNTAIGRDRHESDNASDTRH